MICPKTSSCYNSITICIPVAHIVTDLEAKVMSVLSNHSSLDKKVLSGMNRETLDY